MLQVRVLFELARFHAPSTIFLDELDAIMTTRSGGGGTGDHEGSRRMKTELLMQMDGLNKSDDLVFVLGASNLPWELDPAMLRRLEKRILVDLPTQVNRAHEHRALTQLMLFLIESSTHPAFCSILVFVLCVCVSVCLFVRVQEARKAMFQHHLPGVVQSADAGGGVNLTAEIDYNLVAEKTEGYSGSDIRLVCKEAAMKPVRQIFDILENPQVSDSAHRQ